MKPTTKTIINEMMANVANILSFSFIQLLFSALPKGLDNGNVIGQCFCEHFDPMPSFFNVPTHRCEQSATGAVMGCVAPLTSILKAIGFFSLNTTIYRFDFSCLPSSFGIRQKYLVKGGCSSSHPLPLSHKARSLLI